MGRTRAGRPISTPSAELTREFDFWLGEWDVTWGDGCTGTSSVYCDFDDRVIVESFDGRPSSTIQGMSLSTYDEDAGVWRQCWVDSRGRFTVVSGGFDGEAMDLRTEGELDVVFYAGGSVDVGEAVAETLSLALDPYPRAPEADAALSEAGVKSEAQAKAESSPFAGLAGLKDKLGK